MSSSVHLGSLWPKSDKKDRIRWVLGNYIRSFTSTLDQNLKPEIVSCSSDQTTGSSQDQTDLHSFDQTSDESSLSGIKPEKPLPSDNDGDRSDSEDDKDEKIGIRYARVSDNSQSSDGDRDNDSEEDSIDGQIETMGGIAEKHGIKLPYEPIIDDGQTGTNFNRDGIQRVFQLCVEQDIDYLLVEKVDRIGRSAAETLYFISKLQNDCGVTLITESGERDVGRIDGLVVTTLMSLLAEVQNELRTNKAKKERIRGFLKEKKWHNKSPHVPLGYNLTDDGWIEVDPEEKPIVRELFKQFADCESYAEAERRINNKFDGNPLEGSTVKHTLQQTTYLGKPRLPESWVENYSFENDLHEPQLHLLRPEDGEIVLEEDIFEKVQEIIERKNNQSSTDEEAYSLSDFIAEFSLFSVMEVSDPVKIVHHCGEPMVKDGQVDLGGKYDYTTHQYMCPKCQESTDAEEYYQKWPKQHEVEQMDLIDKILGGASSIYQAAQSKSTDSDNSSEPGSGSDTDE